MYTRWWRKITGQDSRLEQAVWKWPGSMLDPFSKSSENFCRQLYVKKKKVIIGQLKMQPNIVELSHFVELGHYFKTEWPTWFCVIFCAYWSNQLNFDPKYTIFKKCTQLYSDGPVVIIYWFKIFSSEKKPLSAGFGNSLLFCNPLGEPRITLSVLKLAK